MKVQTGQGRKPIEPDLIGAVREALRKLGANIASPLFRGSSFVFRERRGRCETEEKIDETAKINYKSDIEPNLRLCRSPWMIIDQAETFPEFTIRRCASKELLTRCSHPKTESQTLQK